MSLTKDYILAIVPWILKLLVVPENKRKCMVFSFRPIDSIVFLKLKHVSFHYLLTLFLWLLVQWTTEMYLFHISKKYFRVKIHFKYINELSYKKCNRASRIQFFWYFCVLGRWRFPRTTRLSSGGRIWRSSWGSRRRESNMASSSSLTHRYANFVLLYMYYSIPIYSLTSVIRPHLA